MPLWQHWSQGRNKNFFELDCANKLEMLITILKNKNFNTFKRTAEVFNENFIETIFLNFMQTTVMLFTFTAINV